MMFYRASHNSGFVNRLARFSFKGVYSKTIIPNSTCFLVKWYLISMYFVLLRFFPLTVFVIDPILFI